MVEVVFWLEMSAIRDVDKLEKRRRVRQRAQIVREGLALGMLFGTS